MPDDTKKSDQQASKGEGYILGRQKGKNVEPLNNPAADLIRKKIESIYESEPSMAEELKEASQAEPHRSKHQQFMRNLSTSGKPLAQIQQEWHGYYEHLSDVEKHEVWREFYEAHEHRTPGTSDPTPEAENLPDHRQISREQKNPAHSDKPTHETNEQPKPLVSASQYFPEHLKQSKKTHKRPGFKPKKIAASDIKNKLKQTMRHQTEAQTKAKQHFRSLLFGLSLGGLAILVLMFSFFNEIVIARLIQPGGQSADTPIILNANAVAPSDEPQLIIPKINVQLPIVYDVPSNQEEVIQGALDSGVIHYPDTSLPGQKGNGAYFGHSSNNIFNPGKYKFAFVLLSKLVPGDIFYITHKGKVYTYNVYDKRIVSPEETWVLGNAPGKIATAALITCDPPGTTINRLVVWGEQVSPDPTANTNAPAPASNQPQELPAQGPTLWGRFWNWITGGE